MLFAAGLGAQVVGVSTYCHYPPEVSKIAKVGTYTQPNLEVILSLKPGLVVIQKNPIQLKEKLESLHLQVLELNYDNIDGIYHSIEQLERYGGRSRELTAKIRAGLESVRNRAARLPKRRTVFVVGRNPGSLEGTVVAGRGSYLSEVISIAGGTNIFDDTMSAYPKVGLEELLARHPKLRVQVMHAGYPMIDNMLTLLQASSHVYVDVAGLIWSYPIKEVNRYIQRLVEAGFEDRVMFGTDQLQWPKLMSYSIGIIQNAEYLTPEEKRDILYNNAARFLRLDAAKAK